MHASDRFFLTPDQALEAVSRAFAQYPAQLKLLCTLWPMVFGEDAYVYHDPGRRVVWAKRDGRARLVRVGEDDLKRWTVERMRQVPPPLNLLARILAQVFGVRCVAGPGPDANATDGIWVATDMGDFVCTRCGHCCRNLNYRDGCTPDDYARWQALGRSDILEWVGTVRRQGRVVACRIWMLPGTNRYADACPWLSTADPGGPATCTIHDLRPAVCRSYPGSRKHARLTGCSGV